MDPMAPIACSLLPDELAARRDGLLPGLLQRAVSVTAIPDGYRIVPAPDDSDLGALGRLIETERHCCGFLRFQLTVEPGLGPVVLDVSGPPGTREVLDAWRRG